MRKLLLVLFVLASLTSTICLAEGTGEGKGDRIAGVQCKNNSVDGADKTNSTSTSSSKKASQVGK